MSTFADRPNTALLVIDVQRKVVADAHDRDAVVANIAALVDRARAADAPVVWVQHTSENLPRGSEAWSYVPELTRTAGEPLVEKAYGSSFEDTDLEAVLAAARVGHLVVAGAESDACVRASIHAGFDRGYDVTLVGDAHTTNDNSQWGAPTPDQVIAFTNLYWADTDGPGRTAAVVGTTDVSFGG